MPTITDNVYDTGLVPLGPDLHARAHFRIGSAAIGASHGVHVTKDVVVDVDAEGHFSVFLPELATYPRPVPVHVGFSWFVEQGVGSGVGSPQVSWLPFPIFVPRDGGVLRHLIDKQIGNDLVYVGPDAVNPLEQTGFQFNTETSDLYEWRP